MLLGFHRTPDIKYLLNSDILLFQFITTNNVIHCKQQLYSKRPDLNSNCQHSMFDVIRTGVHNNITTSLHTHSKSINVKLYHIRIDFVQRPI